MTTQIDSIRELPDDALIARTKILVRIDRLATAALVVHLAEIEARRLHAAEGCSSLFTYCTRVLHLSEFAAYTRIAAARAGRKFPLLFECLARGDVHLAAVNLLAPHLTEENHRDLLGRARHRSKREVETIVAEIAPRPPVAAMVRRVPVRHVAEAGLASHGATTPEPRAPLAENSMGIPGILNAAAETIASPAPALAEPDSPKQTAVKPARVTPLAPEHYRVQFTADPETVELLRRAQDLLRHQVPNGDPAVVFKMALGDLVQRLERTKIAKVNRPRATTTCEAAPGQVADVAQKDDTAASPRRDSPRRDSRHIPSAVRREVWKRDEGRCAFHTGDGRRCAESGHLEFHHLKPYARGGRATVANIELRCRAHNAYEAALDFGVRSTSFVRERPLNSSRG